ncbi:hypothetical protein STANM309S_00609 [Streptomyces tanashiensis]
MSSTSPRSSACGPSWRQAAPHDGSLTKSSETVPETWTMGTGPRIASRVSSRCQPRSSSTPPPAWLRLVNQPPDFGTPRARVQESST